MSDCVNQSDVTYSYEATMYCAQDIFTLRDNKVKLNLNGIQDTTQIQKQSNVWSTYSQIKEAIQL